MPDKNYDLVIKVTVPFQRVADLMVGALEGGSNYWCDSLKVTLKVNDYPEGCEWAHEAVAAGAGFNVWVDGERVEVAAGSEPITKALQLMAESYPEAFGDFITENDDAETSDVFFQLLCFGEIVYG